MARKRKLPKVSGVLLVDKPAGCTSHDVVQRVRRRIGQRQVGHTGTLDPMATGLLVLALGHATRIARFIEATDKTYVGTVTLGRSTTTYDAEGDTTEEAPVPEFGAAALDAALAGLTGAIEQKVPSYSAVKVDGERLYAKARRGEAVEAPVRTVFIRSLVATRHEGVEIDIETVVSKGTYIRTLAVQIGEALGVPAHLSALRRTAVGRSRVEDAFELDALDGLDAGPPITPIETVLADMPAVLLDAAASEDVSHGRPLTAGQMVALGGDPFEADAELRLVHPQGHVQAVATARRGRVELASQPAGEAGLAYACVLSRDHAPDA